MSYTENILNDYTEFKKICENKGIISLIEITSLFQTMKTIQNLNKHGKETSEALDFIGEVIKHK